LFFEFSYFSAAPTTETPRVNDTPTPAPIDRVEPVEQTNGYHVQNNMGHTRRHQLYVGNLSWWTTDQDITDSMTDVGCTDFQEVKFFENRVNGQSKGFCVVSLGSESSMRMVMDRLPKKEIHGQNPVVTLPTKQALNQFESQQKTRPVPAPTSGGPPFVPRGPAPGPHPGSHPGQGPPQHQPRMMNSSGPMRPGGPPGQYNMQNMQQGPPGGPGQQMQRMQVRGQYVRTFFYLY
jgi:cleavage and polyadenylation specificity factor subunit 6/7